MSVYPKLEVANAALLQELRHALLDADLSHGTDCEILGVRRERIQRVVHHAAVAEICIVCLKHMCSSSG